MVCVEEHMERARGWYPTYQLKSRLGKGTYCAHATIEAIYTPKPHACMPIKFLTIKLRAYQMILTISVDIGMVASSGWLTLSVPLETPGYLVQISFANIPKPQHIHPFPMKHVIHAIYMCTALGREMSLNDDHVLLHIPSR